MRCLIVDDNPLFLENATSLLEREGLDVVGVAADSAAAIRLVAELDPDVALIDIDLGDEDGFDLARRLADGADGPAQVILISTHSERDLAELISASPALGFIQKTQLSARTIRELLDRAA